MPDRWASCYSPPDLVGRLTKIYMAFATRADLDIEPAVLEGKLDQLYARGRAAHPALGLDDESFVTHLAKCGARVDDALTPLHAEDLYLACACLTGNLLAVASLRDLGRPVVVRYLNRIGSARLIADDVEQRLWDAVLVGSPQGPKLATYSGRGPLGSWIGVSAQRIALIELRHEQAEIRARHEVKAGHHLTGDDPEMAAIKDRFRDQFQDAVGAAIGTLEDREKTLFRMHLVDGLTLETIGKVYGVHQTTIFRWLSAARHRVIDEAKGLLRASLPVSSAEFNSIARLLLSEADLSISAALGHLP
jgi:RNA polymerase sigma-70 factor (ECF subfamily)